MFAAECGCETVVEARSHTQAEDADASKAHSLPQKQEGGLRMASRPLLGLRLMHPPPHEQGNQVSAGYIGVKACSAITATAESYSSFSDRDFIYDQEILFWKV